MDIREVVSAYYSIYESKEIKEEVEVDLDESLELLDNLTEEEIEEFVEESIYESLNEGIEYEELVEAFNTLTEDYESDGEFLSELNYSPKQVKRVGSNPDVKTIAYNKKQQAKAELAKKRAKEDKESAKRQSANKRAYQRKEFVKKVSAAGKKVLSKGKEALQKGAESIKSTAKSKVNAVKGDITRRAMDATGTKLKDKRGRPLTSSNYQPQHKSVRDKSKQAIKDKVKSKVKGAIKGIAKTAGRVVGEFEAGRAEAKAKASAPKTSKAREVYQKKTAAAAAQPKKSTTYSMKGAGGGPKKDNQKKWTSGANPAGKPEAPSSTSYRNEGVGRKDKWRSKVTEELFKVCEGKTPDAYDLVLAYIIDEGFADTFEQAEKIMTKLSPDLIQEVHTSQLQIIEDMNKGYVVTNADKKGNTPAWQGYKAGKKKKDGSPLYTPADHLKGEGK